MVNKFPFRTSQSGKRTRVQYTQTDTIRQTDGPLVPMVGLVPIEKDVIPMVLLVNMHLIKGTYITRQFPMVRWYQWYDWYQQKMLPFQWFYWCKTSSLLHQVETRYNYHEHSSFYKPTMQNKFALTPSKNALFIAFVELKEDVFRSFLDWLLVLWLKNDVWVLSALIKTYGVKSAFFRED